MCNWTVLSILAFGVSTQIFGVTCGDAVNKWQRWKYGNCLRGANIWQVIIDPREHGTQIGTSRVGPPFSQEIFDEARRWGANVINISHPGIYAYAYPYGLDTQIQANLDSLINKISAAGLYAVISYRTGPGRTEHAFDSPPSPPEANLIWKSRAAQDAWVRMWKATATRYKNNPAVVGYNLMVEPNSNNTVVNEWDPVVFANKYSGQLVDWYQLAKRIVTAIRTMDTATPLLVSPMNWGDVFWLTKMPIMPDSKTVYVIHQYEPYFFTHQWGPTYPNTYPGFFDGTWDGVPETIDRAWLENLILPAKTFRLAHSVPVAVMEWGVMHRVPNSTVFERDELSIFEKFSLPHATWLWETDYTGVDWDDFNVRAASDSNFGSTLRANWGKNILYKGSAPTLASPLLNFTRDR